MTTDSSSKRKTTANARSAAIVQAAEVAAAVSEGKSVGREKVELSNGIVLKLRPVPPFAMREAALRIKPPKPPIVLIEEKGREEPNPNDPDYIEALDQFAQDQAEAISNILILLGTSVESVPPDMCRPEDDDWIDVFNVLGVEIDADNRHQRYLAWMRFYALETQRDIADVVSSCISRSGVTEAEVQRVVASFRR